MKIEITNEWEAFMQERFPILKRVEKAIYDSYMISMEDMRGKRLFPHIFFARVIFAHICEKEVRPSIYLASYLNRDHATLNYWRKQYINLTDSACAEFKDMEADVIRYLNL